VSVPILPPEHIQLQVQKRQETFSNGIARSATDGYAIPWDLAANPFPANFTAPTCVSGVNELPLA
jgi:hypothetical protein